MILTVLLGGILLLGMLVYLFEVVLGKSRDRE